MFHPFSSLNFALLKSMQVRPVLYFTAKMGATSVKKSSTGNMITIKLGKYFLAPSLERWTHWIVADRRQYHPTWLRRKVFI